MSTAYANLMYPLASSATEGDATMTLSIPVVKVLRAVPVAMSRTTRDFPTVPAVDIPPPKIATQRSLADGQAASCIRTFPMNGSDQVSATFAASEYSQSTIG